jgi:hypothetical protein
MRAATQEDARQTVLELNALEEVKDVKDEDRKTFGRTADGTGESTLDSYCHGMLPCKIHDSLTFVRSLHCTTDS